MNVLLVLITTLFCLIQNISAQACPQQNCNDGLAMLAEKFYINVEQIDFVDQKIYVNANGFVYETPAIHTDPNGYYIDQVAKSGDCSWHEWQCKCGFCNLRGLDWECRSCNKSISQ